MSNNAMNLEFSETITASFIIETKLNIISSQFEFRF